MVVNFCKSKFFMILFQISSLICCQRIRLFDVQRMKLVGRGCDVVGICVLLRLEDVIE